jgi:PTS system mannose-specific IID component
VTFVLGRTVRRSLPVEPSDATAREDRGGLSSATLARVFVRSLFIQAAWNPRGMQGLGFAHAITPALEALYPDPKERAKAVLRHLEFFNCHPYLAAGIIGAAVQLEEKVARGAERGETVSALKRALAPPFAALGDGFFWLALRPAAALVAATTVPALGLWSLAVFLGIYNLVHLSFRAWLFMEGYRSGAGIVQRVAVAQVPTVTSLLKALAALVAGAFAARTVLAALVPQVGPTWRGWHALLAASTIVAMTALLPRLRFGVALYTSLLLGLVIGSRFF